MKLKIIYSILFSNLIFANDTFNDFCKSFLESYDLSGRYTHEYHPFILKKTKESFLELEKILRDSNFEINGRKIILGYQEEAVPPYQTDWSRVALEDEVVVNTITGVAQPAKNIFGFMTGFILKDAEWLERNWYKDTTISKVSHITAHNIDIFRDSAVIFQKHSFGKDYDYLIKSRDQVEKAVYKKDLKSIFGQLAKFWSDLYKMASKTGSGEMVGTQDMLFSIDYAKALIEGQADLKKLYVGPDITYPIEVLDVQKSNATEHAQKFIKIFQNELEPVNDKNTAFIFCSFVDGVGKSTLLNNIKNYQKFGDDTKNYTRCDNSSSQEATVYKLKDKVFLVDLPAQISHFAIKPDGNVFVDINAVNNINNKEKVKIFKFVQKNKSKLIKEFEKVKEKVSKENKPLYTYENPIDQYTQNCLTLEYSDIDWIPFKNQDNYYLFHKKNIQQVRMLVPLAGVHSMGLKVVDPEQMLFVNGLSLPMKYESFLADLKQKLVDADIKHVMFIDFLSMYPRTSRENIRVNFVLQYLKKIYNQDYLINDSFYQHRAYREQETCYLLTNRLEAANKTVILETALRWALYRILDEIPFESVWSLKSEQLEELLKKYTKDILENHWDKLYNLANTRLKSEQEIYFNNYGLDRIYQNVLNFSPVLIQEYSKIVNNIFTSYIQNEYFNTLWSGINQIYNQSIVTNIDKKITLENNLELDIKYKFNSKSKNEDDIKEFVKTLRAQWYAMLANLLNAKSNQENFVIDKIENFVPPIAVKIEEDNNIYAIQKKLQLIDTTQKPIKPPVKYHVIDPQNYKRKWGVFAQKPHNLEWENISTFLGIYGYGYFPFKKPKFTVTKLVELYQQICVYNNKANFCITTTELYKQIVTKNLVEKINKEIHKNLKDAPKLINLDDSAIPAIRLWVRMIATLEMILKDTSSHIIVRKGNKEDFISAIKLLETITLPLYYNIEIKGQLFNDYTNIQPVIPWEIINKN